MKKKYNAILIDSFTHDTRLISHGECSLKVIKEFNDYDIKQINIGVKNNSQASSNKILFTALNSIHPSETSLISIPLSSKYFNSDVHQKINDLSKEGLIFISSYMNNYVGKSYPASYSNVTGVKGISFGNDRKLKKLSQIYYFNDTPTIFFKNNQCDFFYGNSKACALAIRYFLNKRSNQICATDLYNHNKNPSKHYMKLVIKYIENITGKKIEMTNKDIYDLPLFSISIGINRYNINDLLDFIIKKNPTLLKKGFLKLDDISTIRKLTNIIGENNV